MIFRRLLLWSLLIRLFELALKGLDFGGEGVPAGVGFVEFVGEVGEGGAGFLEFLVIGSDFGAGEMF